jgi:hypothetical protein
MDALVVETLLARSKQELDKSIGVNRLAANAANGAVLGFEVVLWALAAGKVDEANLNRMSCSNWRLSAKLTLIIATTIRGQVVEQASIHYYPHSDT